MVFYSFNVFSSCSNAHQIYWNEYHYYHVLYLHANHVPSLGGLVGEFISQFKKNNN